MVTDGMLMLTIYWKTKGRRHSEGLHQAIEAKEGAKIERDPRLYYYFPKFSECITKGLVGLVLLN